MVSQVPAGGTFIGAQSTEAFKLANVQKVDTSQTPSVFDTSAKTVTTTYTTTKPATQQNPPASGTMQGSRSVINDKPKPKAPEKQDPTASTTFKEGATGEILGSFNTNLPTFNKLNMKDQAPVATAGNVGIYGNTNVNVKVDDKTGMTTVTFPGSNNMQVSFPTGESPLKGSIVFDSASKTWAITDVDNVKVDCKYSKAEGDKNGGEFIMIKGGSIDSIDLAERERSDGKFIANDVKSQTLVLVDTTFNKDSKLTVANDRIIANKGTDMSNVKTTVLNEAIGSGGSKVFKQTDMALDNGKNMKNTTRKLQSGFSSTFAFKDWLGGTDKEIKALKSTDIRGTAHVAHKAFSAINSIQDQVPARKYHNLNIYTTAGNGEDVTIMDNEDGTITIGGDGFPGTGLSISKKDLKASNGARIFYDKASGTIFCDNLKGVTFNGPNGKGYNNAKVNLVLNNCDVKYLNTAEFVDSNGSWLEGNEQREAHRSNIALTGNTHVGTFMSSNDNIYYEGNISVDNYYGVSNNAPDALQSKNHIQNQHDIGRGVSTFKNDVPSDDKTIAEGFKRNRTLNNDIKSDISPTVALNQFNSSGISRSQAKIIPSNDRKTTAGSIEYIDPNTYEIRQLPLTQENVVKIIKMINPQAKIG